MSTHPGAGRTAQATWLHAARAPACAVGAALGSVKQMSCSAQQNAKGLGLGGGWVIFAVIRSWHLHEQLACVSTAGLVSVVCVWVGGWGVGGGGCTQSCKVHRSAALATVSSRL